MDFGQRLIKLSAIQEKEEKLLNKLGNLFVLRLEKIGSAVCEEGPDSHSVKHFFLVTSIFIMANENKEIKNMLHFVRVTGKSTILKKWNKLHSNMNMLIQKTVSFIEIIINIF